MRRTVVLALTVAASAGCHIKHKPWSIAAADPTTQRMTTSGAVVGGAGKSGGDAWLGIPFAAPPVGDLRWRAPQPPASWSGTREALHFSSSCTQFTAAFGGEDGEDGEEGAVTGSEDCLYLNVFVPHFTPDAVPTGGHRLPVMVWIHGGGNSIGRASLYDAGKLASSENILVITTQYRLGPLGWFRHQSLRNGAHDAAEASGNFGTLDLIRALQWVRDNAAAFGGDPNNVTIFGESAGGQNVYSLLVSPLARGLFQRAISESGGLSETTTNEAERYADDPAGGNVSSSSEALARMLVADGHASDPQAARAVIAGWGDERVASYLRGKTPQQIYNAYADHKLMGMIRMPLVINDGTVLPTDWLGHLGKLDGWNKVPVLVGTNRDEAKLFLFFSPRLIHRILGLLPRFVNEPLYEAMASALSRSWQTAGADDPATAMFHSGNPDVYVYRFDWHGEPTVHGAELGKMLGAAHGMEIPFVFGLFDFGRLTEYLFPEDTASERGKLSDSMMSWWTQFAMTGSPGRGRGGNLQPWPAFGDGSPFMLLDTDSEGGTHVSNDVRTMAQVVDEVDNDPRLPNQMVKCAVFHEMAGFAKGLKREQYEHAGRVGCAEYPFDKFPWGLK